MLRGVTVLLVCQLAGEVLVRLTGLPVPGPVVGMVLLFVLLQLRPPEEDRSRSSLAHGTVRAADVLLRHLQLLFVPAGVGVVVYLGVLREEALPIGVALVGSWLAGLLVVGWSAAWLVGRRAVR